MLLYSNGINSKSGLSERNQKLSEKENSILFLKNRFGSGGIGASEFIYGFIPNLMDFGQSK
jgi:hypothetical protein